ncbi:hypothetical protein OIU79_018492 [Salix purpurea]|uniref:Piezo non-specific cation channel R-Ras-binding domain-containing protein n=1 Tax=Salix purpurea TaxID=77065 RepID=A0A9Q0WY45_SALPP|nr:hypothetical protein OIU79_018492 [Salix purpurea]
MNESLRSERFVSSSSVNSRNHSMDFLGDIIELNNKADSYEFWDSHKRDGESLLSMVYPAVLFLYALCVNTGPLSMFWVIMLIYTEMCIFVQYLYQIIIQHCGLTFNISLLQELGFPAHKTLSSFVISNLPLFLVYLFTLLQTSITARDRTIADARSQKRNNFQEEVAQGCMGRIETLLLSAKNVLKLLIRSLFRYWKSLTQGAETPPYFVQVSMKVDLWPEDGIQPDRIKSGNKQAARGCTNVDLYKSLTPAADVAYEILEAQRAGIVREIRFPYPILSVIGGGKKDIDLYAYVFCADLAVFFLVAIFYHSVIKNNSEFLEVYQLEDQFPKEFVFILMVIFFLIVLDRVIYLCSFATGKVLFYLFNLALFTYSVTEYAWYTEPQHRHAGRLALRAIYLTKAISLALQAIQIRFGVPHESTLYRQFLTSSISRINHMGFRVYRALPFLYELRCVLDWSCTTTSLTMYDWLKLEDIHASLFLVKCDAVLNREKTPTRERSNRRGQNSAMGYAYFLYCCV